MVGNLPHQLTSFVGRRREATEVKRLLSASRLVTLTGAGGVGKTRLALRVAEQVRRAFPDGVWLVQFDRLGDDALVAQAVAGALGLVEQAGRPTVDALAEHLAGRQVLLVLDNCEHLVDAVAKLADRLLRAAADLRILATSREPLGIGGEALWSVPPLSVPDRRRPVRPEDLLRFESVSLLIERATPVVPGFALTADNQVAIADICRLLEGLPLAIELAVPRLRVLTPAQFRERFSSRLAMLSRGSLTAPPRHRSLEACVQWSYLLCTGPERRLWARLSVFAGGFDTDAAEQVCGGIDIGAGNAFEVVAALVDKSVLIRDDHGDTVRFRMLETLREYGAARLAERAEVDEVERRHRDYYAGLARRAEAAWTGPHQLHWSRVLGREHANLQAAIRYCLRTPSEVAAAQELTGHLWFFWIACGRLREGRYYLQLALARGGDGEARRWALWACAFVAGSQGDLDVAESLLEECRIDASRHGDRLLTTYTKETRGMVSAIRGDLDTAVDLLRECVARYRSLDDLDVGLLRTLPMLGVTLTMRGDLDAALELAPECLRLCQRLGERWQRSYVDYFVGLALHGRGEPARAVEHLVAAIATKHQFHDIVGLVMCVEPLAAATAALGDGARTARLLGAASALWETFGLPSFGSPFHSEGHRRTVERARERLGPADYERAFGQGRAMDLDDTVAYALSTTRARPPAQRPEPGPLTPRELEVAELVGQGLTSRQIATRLVVSPRTVESHLEHIMDKLGFVKRTQLAAWVAARRS